MHIIPVIDVRHGIAVRAVAGERASYKPLVTPLAASADPVAVAAGYRALFPFRTLYVADLDGIEGRGANLGLVRDLSAALPDAVLWVDNGASNEDSLNRLTALANVMAVIGSESGVSAGELVELGQKFGNRFVLSLDFRGEEFQGEPALLETPSSWPPRVVAMTLARVGTASGPDIATIATLSCMAGAQGSIYAAGGIRNRADLEAARAAGAVGALVATSLHNGQIKASDLVEIARS